MIRHGPIRNVETHGRPGYELARIDWDTDESTLVLAIKGDDPERSNGAFEILFQRYERQIHAHIYRMVLDEDEAEDLTQDCFVKAYKAIRDTSDDLNFAAWLYRIARNSCLDVLRRKQRIRWQPWEQTHDFLLLTGPEEEPEAHAVKDELRRATRAVLAAMSERHRWALILREYHGLPCDEIGSIMGLSRSAVKSMLFRARKEFRSRMTSMFPDYAEIRARVRQLSGVS